jgi:hypothetical protein
MSVKKVRTAVIGMALALVGCAATPEDVAPPVARVYPPLAPHCPYANVYVNVAAQGEKRDLKIAERVRTAYVEILAERGFQVVPAPDEAYWSAFSLVHMNQRVDSTFAWSVYMMATQDLRGRVQTPVRFAAATDDQGDLSGFMLLKEIRLLELDLQVRAAAEGTAQALLPHTSRMCIAWAREPQDDDTQGFHEVRNADDLVEKLRDELAQEIERVRRARQHRSLEVGLEPSS